MSDRTGYNVAYDDAGSVVIDEAHAPDPVMDVRTSPAPVLDKVPEGACSSKGTLMDAARACALRLAHCGLVCG